MKATALDTDNPDIHLIEPNVERDAPLGVTWLNGKLGRKTLELMGNSADAIDAMLPTTLQDQEEIMTDFIESQNQLNWMIEFQGDVVGAVWADLKPSEHLQSPSVHIMIGDSEVRGKGIGLSSVSAVIEHLGKQGHEKIYSRYRTNNEGSKHLLANLGFREIDEPYADKDNLEFQNVVKETNTMTQEFTKPPVEVELARPEDAAEVFDVQRRTWLATYPNEEADISYEDIRRRLEGENGELIPQKVERWKEGIEARGETRETYIVRSEGKVVGFIAPSIRDKQRRIGAIYVLPEAQGKGIGGALLKKALAWHGDDQDVYLHVATYNQNAVDFYKRYGFEQTDAEIVDEIAIQNGNTPIPEIEMVRRAKA